MEFATTPPQLAAEMDHIERAMGGRLCFAIQNLQTGESYARRATEKCKTASIIKLPMLVYLATAVHAGELSWDQTLTLTDAEKVGGSGVLTLLGAGLKLTLKDVCMLMTIISDNTGTNMLIEEFGVEPVNNCIRAIGLQHTTLLRKSFAVDTHKSAAYGLGVTTAEDMCLLVATLARREESGDAAATECLGILEHQAFRDGIPRLLPPDWKYAGKTGAIDHVRNDVGLVTTASGARYALAILCQDLHEVLWTPENRGLLAIAEVARLLTCAL